MNQKLTVLINDLSCEDNLISAERKIELEEIASKIKLHLQNSESLDIVVVCTHNSRRSQLGEAWINVLANHFDINNVKAFSGGMEATAFNERMVNAMRECGFNLVEVKNGSNPKYTLGDLKLDNHFMYSKVYDDGFNPTSGFMAFMVCGHADENCPVVQGMKYRIPLRYKDPKAFDDTEYESRAYIDKVKEIGREIYFLLSQIN